MTTSLLEQLDADIERLSLTDQLWLLERLAQRIRTRSTLTIQESDLIAMANDPDIQRELRQIQYESGNHERGLW